MFDKQEDFSIIDSCNEFLENYIKNITNLTSETTQSEANNTVLQKELDSCTEQKFRVIQIKKAMPAYIEHKNVSQLNLD